MPKTLLLADDSVTIQKVVGITFANEDVELVTVDNGDDALIRAREIRPDLVLADIGMPGLDGYALCSAIRKDPDLSHTPVLLLTGTFETYDEQRAQQVGASGHISKPFEAQTLVDRVLGLLSQSVAAPASPANAATRPTLATAMPAPSAPAPAPSLRPELPPLPSPSVATPARTAKPRAISAFDFDVSPEPSPATTEPAAPLWEAEPDFEATDDAPARRSQGVTGSAAPSEGAPGASHDSTRLFAPDLLGRSTRLPDEAPPAPPAPPDFSFEDLDFEEPTGSPGSHTQIFGESSGPISAETVVATPALQMGADEPEDEAPFTDSLYSKTRFLDPGPGAGAAPSFDTPMPVLAPPLPDLLESEEITAPSHTLGELELTDAEPEIDAEPLDDADPFAEPFSANTSAAFEEPEFEIRSRPRVESPPSHASTRLLTQDEASTESDDEVDLEGELLDVEPIPESPMQEPPQELDAWSEIEESAEPDARPTAPLPVVTRPADLARVAAPMIDSALMSQTLEKVAWEAFGSLSEQVVNEVRKRVEAVVWEVVPQMCERLIREEIERLKAELPE